MSEPLAETVMQEEGTTPARQGDPCVLVIFGASGDLTRRLLVPSLYNLAHDKLLTENFAVVGVARNESSHEEFRQAMHKAIHESNRVGHVDPAIWDSLEQRLYYVTAPFQDPSGYTKVAEVLKQCDRDGVRRGTISSTSRHHRRSLARSCNTWARLAWPRSARKKAEDGVASSLRNRLGVISPRHAP